MATQIRTLQAETVDALCWRHYGRTRGAVEAVLQANPGLASCGPLPAPAPKPTVSLWD